MVFDERPNLIHSASYFPVCDVQAAVAYYEHVFGFRSIYEGGIGPEFAIVERDDFRIMFKLVSGPLVPNEDQGGTWDVFFWVRDAESLYSELMRKGAEIAHPRRIQEHYQMKEFAARDLNGYVLGFGEQI